MTLPRAAALLVLFMLVPLWCWLTLYMGVLAQEGQVR